MSGPFSTKLLDEALQQKREEGEARRLQKIEEACLSLEALSKGFFFKRAYLFGSLTKPGQFIQNSDFDIAIEGLATEDFISALSFLSSKLGRDVDLVRLEDFKWREKIIREGIPWKKPR